MKRGYETASACVPATFSRSVRRPSSTTLFGVQYSLLCIVLFGLGKGERRRGWRRKRRGEQVQVGRLQGEGGDEGQRGLRPGRLRGSSESLDGIFAFGEIFAGQEVATWLLIILDPHLFTWRYAHNAEHQKQVEMLGVDWLGT